MHSVMRLLCFLLLLLETVAAHNELVSTSITNKARRRAASVKDAFDIAWTGYYALAFPADELLPISQAPGQTRYGWGATAVEALTTAIIMEDKRAVQQILEHIPTIDWGITRTGAPLRPGSTEDHVMVNIFEAATRYMGSLLSAYELLSGPHQSMCPNTIQRTMLLQQAHHLANNLSRAFEKGHEMPWPNIHLNGIDLPEVVETTPLADVAGMELEWTALGRLTMNTTYPRMIEKVMKQLIKQHPRATEPFKGLLADRVHIQGGYLVGEAGGWDVGSDAYYDMLLKMYIYDPDRYKLYRGRWLLAAESINSNLISRVQARKGPMFFLSRFDGQATLSSASQLSCSAGASFLLGGALQHDPQFTRLGRELIETCEHMYNATSRGIGPEEFAWPRPGVAPEGDQQEFVKLNGFAITKPGYSLSTKLLEGLYYAYRMTGDTKYQDLSFRAFKAIRAWTRVGPGFSSFSAGVNAPIGENGQPPYTGLQFQDRQDARFFSETLKYAYLIHAEDAEYQVNHNGSIHWVYSTAGHPFKIVGRKAPLYGA